MRRVSVARRALLPLAVPYLGVACLALLALASGHALTAGASSLHDATAAHAVSVARLLSASEAQVGAAATRAAAVSAATVAGVAHAPALWGVRPRQAPTWAGAASAAASPARGLLIAVALARGH